MTGLLVFLLVFLALSLLLGLPISFGIGVGALSTFFITGFPLSFMAQGAFAALNNFSYMAIPFFMFSGYIMEYSGISEMLFNMVKAWIGRVKGSVGAVTVVSSMAFGTLTGSILATASAIGRMTMPAMEKEGYPAGYAAGLVAASSFLGVLIPPSSPGILYAVAANLKVSDVWLCTVGPGILIGMIFIMVNYFIRRRVEIAAPSEGAMAYFKTGCAKTKDAVWALLMPIIIFGGIYGGVFTATEAGAISCVYGIIYFLVRKKRQPDRVNGSLLNVFVVSASITGAIGLISIMSNIVGRAISFSGASTQLAQLITSNISSPYTFLMMCNVLFLIWGCFLDINSAILLLVPLLAPTVSAMGIDPLHFSAVTMVNLCIGNITPPFALSLFTVAKLTKANFMEIVRGVLPFLFASLAVLIIITYIPEIPLFFPRLING